MNFMEFLGAFTALHERFLKSIFIPQLVHRVEMEAKCGIEITAKYLQVSQQVKASARLVVAETIFKYGQDGDTCRVLSEARKTPTYKIDRGNEG